MLLSPDAKNSRYATASHKVLLAWVQSTRTCGAEKSMEKVEMTVNMVNRHRQSRSTTIAANFQSLHSSWKRSNYTPLLPV